MKKGLFIVFEGIDGSGKGTQSKMLCSWLKKKGFDVVLTSEPSDSKIGRLIRGELKEGGLDAKSESLLFAADRKNHNKLVSSSLDNGKIVISDRYVYSSLAYQGARGVDQEWILSINDSLLEPNLLILLDIDPKLAVDRVNKRVGHEDYFEKAEFLKKVRGLYLEQSGIVVDAARDVDAVHDDIIRIVSRVLR